MEADCVRIDSLFDADLYLRSGNQPWTFFAYPTDVSVDHCLPPDKEACRMLGAVQAKGIDVSIWVNGHGGDTTYFACREEDIKRLGDVLRSTEFKREFGAAFCEKHSEALFMRQRRDN